MQRLIADSQTPFCFLDLVYCGSPSASGSFFLLSCHSLIALRTAATTPMKIGGIKAVSSGEFNNPTTPLMTKISTNRITILFVAVL